MTYVTRFVPNLATIVEPLRRLLKSEELFKWTNAHHEALKQIKIKMAEKEYLGFFKVGDQTQVMADASPVGLGAILMQKDQEGSSRVIAYASRTLNKWERKFYQTEREALALVWAVEKFHLYLFGHKFELLTDCKALEFLFKPTAKPCLRIERWILRLLAYDFIVVHINGTDNLADPLSRLLKTEDTIAETDVMEEENLICWVRAVAPTAISPKQIEHATVKDETCEIDKKAMRSGNWTNVPEIYRRISSEICQVGEVLLRGGRIIIPNKNKCLNWHTLDT